MALSEKDQTERKQLSRIICNESICKHPISSHTEDGCRLCRCEVKQTAILDQLDRRDRKVRAVAAAKVERLIPDDEIPVVLADVDTLKQAYYQRNATELGGPIAARYNQGKTMLSIQSALAYWLSALDYTYGAMKYAPDNWRKGMAWSEIMNSFERHYFAFKMGEDIDEESGLPHIALALWNMTVLADYSFTRPEFDDRAKYDPKVMRQLRELQQTVNEKVKAYKAKQK